ncbi:MAG: hypothetical protein ACRDT2_06575 [Natronosporangium sp.]
MIRARVADAKALAARPPAALSMYLRSTGWRLAERSGTVASWVQSAGAEGEFEILQPLDPGSRDYAARVGDAVATLAVAEDRSELDILRAITEVSDDVHSVSIFPVDEPPGLIALEDGVTAYESLRSLVVASAYPVFARQHRVVQPARKPQELTDFLRTVRIGPAAEGSYTLTVHTPVPPRLAQQPPLFESGTGHLPDDYPVGRQVSLRMYAAIRAACQAAEAALLTSDGLDPFTDAVAEGLSANLCEALVGLGGGAGHPFEMSLSLAAVRAEPTQLAPVRFRRDHLPVLREAAVELRARTPEEDVVVTGDVVRLHREAGGAGEITLAGRVDDQEPLRRIWLDLPADDYATAMRAHQEMREVNVSGNLVRRGTRYVLTHPSGFRVRGES